MAVNSSQSASADSRRRKLVSICEQFPETTVEPCGEGHLAFRIRKRIFTYYVFDHHGDGIIAVNCKASLSEQRRLVKNDPITFYVPQYLGAKGWIGIRLDLDEVDWDAVTELVRGAYQALAPRKLAALVE